MATDVVLTAGANITLVPDDVAHTLTIEATGGIGPEGPEGPEGPPGPAGPSAVSADANNQAVLGSDNLIFVPQSASGGMSEGEWMFSTTTTAPPSSGQIRLNNASQSAATAMYIHNVTAPGIDAGNMLRFTIIAGCKLVLQEKNNSANYIEYSVTAAPTVQSGYLEAPVAVVVAGGAVPAQRCLLMVVAPQGDVTTARTLSAGAGLTGGGDLSTNRTFDVGAGAGISVGADSVALTVPTDAQIRSATGSVAVLASSLESAAAFVALTDAATVAVDWDAGINRSLTVTANRAIGNPTNGQIGTYRTILVQGNDANARTITFGNQFLGSVPTITDVTSTKWYLITILCITTSHFVATSVQAK